ncbi:hypothetical protein ACVWXN_003497 [Bradyrhizobium sp. i1.4.4]
MTFEGGRNFRNPEAAARAIGDRQPGLKKPTLRRYTWSRLHGDLLDDNRWALVASRVQAPLALVEALIVRLEAHASKSEPRGYVGDFSAEGMAVRWGVEPELVLRVVDELESAPTSAGSSRSRSSRSGPAIPTRSTRRPPSACGGCGLGASRPGRRRAAKALRVTP